MIIKSLITLDNPFNSTEEIRQWIERRNQEVEVKVDRIPLSEMKMWHTKNDGSIHHNSGRFFSIVGIDVCAPFLVTAMEEAFCPNSIASFQFLF